MQPVLAAVRVRNCTITRAEILMTPAHGGIIRVQTNRTGSHWAHLNRDMYNGIVEAIGSLAIFGGESIRKWLLEKVVTIRAEQRAFGTKPGYVMWFARVQEIPGIVSMDRDYRRGSRNHG